MPTMYQLPDCTVKMLIYFPQKCLRSCFLDPFLGFPLEGIRLHEAKIGYAHVHIQICMACMTVYIQYVRNIVVVVRNIALFDKMLGQSSGMQRRMNRICALLSVVVICKDLLGMFQQYPRKHLVNVQEIVWKCM